jgi:REP element-mobilizing transposase RayT
MNRDEHIESGVYYHVYNRGNDRDRIFGDESDYAAFIEKMKSLATKYNVEVPVYALMPNHYHLIAKQYAVEDRLSVEGRLLQGKSKIEDDILSRFCGESFE